MRTFTLAGRALAALALTTTLAWAATSSSTPDETKQWGYHDSATTVGPSHWGNLPGNELCSTGQMQTPIALRSDQASAGIPVKLTFDYKPSPLKMLNNGHTIHFEYAAGSDLKILDAAYQLLQFHFHAPSEHTLDGKRFPLELHFVHTGPDGKPAVVVGVFIEEGAHNAALDQAFRRLPRKKGQTVAPAGAVIDAKALLPDNQVYFHYVGSLTTPPCTEGLDWYVMKTPITMDAAQIRAYTSIPHLGHTSRPLQNLGSRKIEKQ